MQRIVKKPQIQSCISYVAQHNFSKVMLNVFFSDILHLPK